ncbi:MAG: S8 family peptidase [Lachnospiraceae bacterium]|nr:S8 family peptidase [Lachnospiraceae bacterium]
MNRVRSKIHADKAHQAGYTGRGITAAVLDTGICLHPDYRDRIVLFRDFVNGERECYDDASHGSHVSGILGGDGRCLNGKYRGIAPECRIIHLKVLDRFGRGKVEHLLAGINWVIENRETYKIRIMNISAGASREDQESIRLVNAVERAWDAGLTVVVAAGNMGPGEGTVTVPGNSRKVITVGSSDDFRSRCGSGKAAYSGQGPTSSCVCKPELVAPGTGIVSCAASWQKSGYYQVKSGTSMAAPVVSGCVALLFSAAPGLTNVEAKMELKKACVDLGLPFNRQGWGMPDLEILLRLGK